MLLRSIFVRVCTNPSCGASVPLRVRKLRSSVTGDPDAQVTPLHVQGSVPWDQPPSPAALQLAALTAVLTL